MNRIAIYEMPVPESCFACLFCLPSDVRSGLFCRGADLITDDYHSSRHPDCPLKIVSSCASADKTADGKCRGYQKSDIDDEPAKECMNCEKNEFYEGGA